MIKGKINTIVRLLNDLISLFADSLCFLLPIRHSQINTRPKNKHTLSNTLIISSELNILNSLNSLNLLNLLILSYLLNSLNLLQPKVDYY